MPDFRVISTCTDRIGVGSGLAFPRWAARLGADDNSEADLSMRIRAQFLIWTNGALLLLWGLFLLVDEWSERAAMFRLEVRTLRSMAEQVRLLGFDGAAPRPGLPEIVARVAAGFPDTEVMVLDADGEVVASSFPGRVGKPWREEDIARVLRGETTFAWKVDDHRHGATPMLDVTLAVPATVRGGAPRAVHVAGSLETVEARLRNQRWTRLAWAGTSMLLMGLVIGVVSHRRLLRPLARVMRIMAGSRWSHPRDLRGDELERLGAAVSQMVADADAALDERDRLLAQVRTLNRGLEQRVDEARVQLSLAHAELVQKERLAAVGELAAGLAHELRTPMHIVRGAAELLAASEANQEACQDIFEEVDRVSRFVDELLLFARPFVAVEEPTLVAPVIGAVVAATWRGGAGAGAGCQVVCPRELEVRVGEDHLHQVLSNLVSNAAAATADRGTVTIEACEAGGRVQVRVRDDGEGIAAQDLERIFAPFFTRRAGGTGLGLAIVRRLVNLYGGTIEVTSEPGRGATFVVSFPATEPGDDVEEETAETANCQRSTVGCPDS